LVREYTDIWAGRWRKEDWRVSIIGVEAFAPYINPATRYYYDEVLTIDIRDAIKRRWHFDVVMAVDVIEHLPKDDGILALNRLCDIARRAAIFSIPVGQAWLDANKSYAEVNPFERHQAAYELDELAELIPWTRIHTVRGVRGDIAVVCLQK